MIRAHLLLIFLLPVLISGCLPTRALVRNVPNTDDYKFFPEAQLSASAEPSPLYYHPEPLALNQVEVRLPKAVYLNMEEIFEEEGTLAFMMLKNDTIIYENYFNKFDTTQDLVTSFSIAKAFTNTLVAMAIEKGFLEGLEQPVTDWMPELMKRDSAFTRLKIKHLVDMTSGLKIGAMDLAQVYYGRQLDKYCRKVKLEHEPGTVYTYNNANTQLLAVCLERSTDKQLETLMQEWIWTPLGMESDAIWSKDRKHEEGMPKAFCCINGNAHDFARFGLLYLNDGVWQGERMVPEWWVDSTRSVDTTEGRVFDYHGHWHHYLGDYGFYQAGGLFEQYILVAPERDMVLVHFCEKNRIRYSQWKDRFSQMFDQLDLNGSLDRFYPGQEKAPFNREDELPGSRRARN